MSEQEGKNERNKTTAKEDKRQALQEKFGNGYIHLLSQ